MKKKPFIPTEIKDYSPHFFILCVLFVLASAWALWDEIETRRPWKSYQRKFRSIEYSVVSDQFLEAEKNLVAKIVNTSGIEMDDSEDISKLIALLREKVEELTGDESYQDYLEELRKIDRELYYVSQEIRFTRSEADELFYRWKHKLRIEEDFSKYEEDWHEKQSVLAALEENIKGLEERSESLRSEFLGQSDILKSYQRALQELEVFQSNKDERLDNIKNRQPEIRQIVLQAFGKNRFGQPEDRVDRCMSCHVAIDGKGFEEQPQPFSTHPDVDYWFSNHPYEKMGCTPCHRGQGAALQSVFYAHGYRVVEEFEDTHSQHGREYLEHWEEPMFEGDHIQTSCPLCHQTFEITGADVLNDAKLLFTELGCHACHFTKDFEEKAKIGPDLSRIMSKVYPEWLIKWLENPREYLPKTRMPNYQFSEEQIVSISSFLHQNSEPYQFTRLEGRNGSIDRGKELVESRGCLGCHSIEDHEAGGYLAPLGYDLVPDLTRIGEKVSEEWLIDWLIDPKAFRPTSKMPNLNLTDDEVIDIAAYLLSKGEPREIEGLEARLNDEPLAEEGYQLIYDYGCYSCHDIKGFEEASRIAPPLSDFGNKDAAVELYFGDAYAKPEFRIMYGDVIETWDNWTFNKLKNPRIFEDEVSKSKMPAFDLSDENANALLILLSSFNGKSAPEEYRRVLTEHERKVEEGKNLVRTLNCVGCHLIEGKGGDIRKFYDNEALAPPILTGEGDKVQAGWLFEFLKKPTVLRPWLDIRMPFFDLTDEQASVIVEYFNSLSKKKIPFSFFDIESVSSHNRSLGRELFGTKDTPEYASSLKCGSCHPKGRDLPEGNPSDWGPDLFLANERLKPEWFEDWLRNPQAIQPGTRMPNYFYDYDEFEGEIDITELLPEPEVKILALRDYIMSEGY